MSTVTITPALVKELRERTGVGMAKCKEALDHSKGDMEEAVSYLRKAGMASAVKKAGRATQEGTVVAFETEGVVALAEVDAETDFVVKNDRFQEFCKNIVQEVALKKPASLELFLQQPYSKDPQITIDQYRSLLIQTIGENIIIRRVAFFPKTADCSIGVYSHLGGKIVTIVVLQGAKAEGAAKDVAMHVAAASPEYVCPEQVPQELILKEKEIAKGQITNKPPHIIEKILEGKVNAFFDLVCLTRQKFVKDDSMTIADFLKKQGAQLGTELKVTQFVRWMAGKD